MKVSRLFLLLLLGIVLVPTLQAGEVSPLVSNETAGIRASDDLVFPTVAANQERTIGILLVDDPGEWPGDGGYVSACVNNTRCNTIDHKCEIGTTGCAWRDDGKCKSCTFWT